MTGTGERNRRAGRSVDRSHLIAALILLTVSLPVAAEPIRDGRSYPLETGDRVVVTVFGQPELSGDLMVDGDGNLNIPFLDPVPVRGLSPIQAQTVLHDRLADGFLRQPSVSVRISEPRPLYVLGDVRTPGIYPYRYGSTVQAAVAAAGGFGIMETAQSTAVSDFLASEERLRQLTFQKQSLLVRVARLQAQADGRSSFSPPNPESTPGFNITPIIENETNTFESQAAIQRSQLDLLRAQKPHLESEIASHLEQIAAEKKQLDVIKQEADRIDRLVRQGLATQTNGFQLKLSEAAQELNVWRLTAEVSRLRVQLGEFDIKAGELTASFTRQITVELRDARERLQELEATLPVARQLRDTKLQYVGGLIQTGIKRSITITRTINGESRNVDAIEDTPLQPGDVIEIKKLLPDQPLGKAAVSEEVNSPALHAARR